MLGGAGLGCGEHQASTLPPLGEVLVSVDTDAPVPEFVGRLRVDVFDEQGTWLESRDMARTNESDWPASFSLYTEDSTQSRRVLVRARAYLEGRVRSYEGERFEPRATFVEPPAAQTLPELCSNAPPLVLGQELTVRRGARALTGTIPEQRPADAPSDWTPQCGIPFAGGTAAAQLQITEAGDYHIEATRVRPAFALGGDAILFLRTDCRNALSQIACVDDSVPVGDVAYLETDLLPRIITHLDVGSYTVLAGGFISTPSDITLRATLASKWADPPPVAPTQPAPATGLPRLVVDGTDTTPREEPLPLVTIDRLALLTLVPGQKRLARLVLHVACAGQMAKLSQAGSNASPVIAEAETCVDTEGAALPLSDEPSILFNAAPEQSLVGTFAHGQACPPAAKQDSAACVPAGEFVMGSNEASYWLGETTAERFALMNRFWLDKTEVSVGRWRAALSRGFKSPTRTPIENNGPLAAKDGDSTLGYCTVSATPAAAVQAREDFPITCVDWPAARAFCRFEGGDLPTEAQWQYAATKAGKSLKTTFPWGDQPPSCAQAVSRRDDPPGWSDCRSTAAYGEASVTDPAVAGDTTALGILDLAGNVSEWGLDSYSLADSACWTASTLVDPVCWEQNAPERTVLGGYWAGPANRAAGWTRARATPSGYVFNATGTSDPIGVGGIFTGFRCAYPEEPQ